MEDKSRLERYCLDVVNGKVIACGDVKKQAEMMLEDIHATSGRWRFDRKAAERPCRFIESFCKIPSGKLGQPFVLEDYEAAWVQSIFGFMDENERRRFTECLIVVARKNGKTSLAAAIELYMLIGDGEGAPQIYNLATSGDQSSLGFNACLRMVRQSSLIGKYAKKGADRLSCPMNYGYIKPLASRPGTLDGLDSHAVVVDELAAMTDRDLYDLMKQSMASREQPLLLEITTNGFVRNSIFDAQLEYAEGVLSGDIKDERFLPWIYRLDDMNEWRNPESWQKANPGLGTVKKFETLKSNVDKAMADSSFRPTVLTKDFNMPQNTSIAWLNFEEAVNKEKFDIREMGFRYAIFGFDASDTVDLTCAQALMMRPGDDRIYEMSMYWIPEDTIINDSESGHRKERDGVPYQAWIARGLLRTVPGNKIDKRVLIEWMQEVQQEYDIYPYAVGFDPWHMDDSTLRELEQYVGKGRVFKVRQGAQTLSQPMKQIRADYAANRIVDNDNPLNSWCRMNVAIRTDVNGNIQPDKKKNDPRNRIDGFAAEIDGYITLMNLYQDYQQVI